MNPGLGLRGEPSPSPQDGGLMLNPIPIFILLSCRHRIDSATWLTEFKLIDAQGEIGGEPVVGDEGGGEYSVDFGEDPNTPIPTSDSCPGRLGDESGLVENGSTRSCSGVCAKKQTRRRQWVPSLHGCVR